VKPEAIQSLPVTKMRASRPEISTSTAPSQTSLAPANRAAMIILSLRIRPRLTPTRNLSLTQSRSLNPTQSHPQPLQPAMIRVAATMTPAVAAVVMLGRAAAVTVAVAVAVVTAAAKVANQYL